MTAADEARRLRGAIDARQLRRDRFAAGPGYFELANTPPQRVTSPLDAPVLFDFGSPRPPAARRALLLFGQPDRLAALDPAGRTLAWETQLRLLGVHPLDIPTDVEPPVGMPRAVVDGQTALVNGPTGLFAVGLWTGRRLWGMPYEDPDSLDAYPLRNRLVAAEDGWLVSAPRRGVLACSRVADGAEIVWERILAGEKLDSVFVSDGLCVTLSQLSSSWEQVTTYDLQSGRLLGQVSFDQPAPDMFRIPMVYARGHLVGPDGGGEVVCYSARTGEENWRIPLERRLRWVFRADEDFVGVSTAGGGLLLIDTLSGDVALRCEVPDADDGYLEAVIHDDIVVVLTVKHGSRGDEPVLLGLDRATGRVRWTHDGLGVTGASRFALWRLLHIARDVVPMVYREPVASDNPFERAMGEIGVMVVDKASGRIVGAKVGTGQSSSLQERLTGDLGLWPDRLVLGTRRMILSLPLRGQRAATGEMR
jgi:outer membrane protein assembly factor BamB